MEKQRYLLRKMLHIRCRPYTLENTVYNASAPCGPVISLNKSKNWQEVGDSITEVTHFVRKAKLPSDGLFYIGFKPSRAEYDSLKQSASNTGSHCLRKTREERGRQRSEHKKNKNLLRKAARESV